MLSGCLNILFGKDPPPVDYKDEGKFFVCPAEWGTGWQIVKKQRGTPHLQSHKGSVVFHTKEEAIEAAKSLKQRQAVLDAHRKQPWIEVE